MTCTARAGGVCGRVGGCRGSRRSRVSSGRVEARGFWATCWEIATCSLSSNLVLMLSSLTPSKGYGVSRLSPFIVAGQILGSSDPIRIVAGAPRLEARQPKPG